MAEMRYDEVRQRQALLQLVESPQFLASEQGGAFIAELASVFVPIAVTAAQRIGLASDWVSQNEVVNTIIVGLSDSDGRVARKAASSHLAPWAYLTPCIRGWLRALWGGRHQALHVIEQFEGQCAAADTGLTDIETVVSLTFELLAAHSPPEVHADLLRLVHWLAHNPPQRSSYESEDRAAARWLFRGLAPQQIDAVTLISWGGRPNRLETSLMGAYLLDYAFQPYESSSHLAALLRFQRAMRSATVSFAATQSPRRAA